MQAQDFFFQVLMTYKSITIWDKFYRIYDMVRLTNTLKKTRRIQKLKLSN